MPDPDATAVAKDSAESSAAAAPAEPAPVARREVTFADFKLAEPINRAIAEIGYTVPTPIQAQAIPVVMQGRDVMGAAQTGTGKTAGFALPILQRLMVHANTSASPARHPVRALILAPTRELADQIYENVRHYAKHTGLRSAAVFGGVDIAPQIRALRAGAEVLVATPGRLLDHVGQRTVNLSGAEVLVLDEADRMLDMGFLPDIQRIIQLLPKSRQNLMFSATFSKDIRKLAESFLNNPQLIEVAARNAAADNVEQLIYRVRDVESKRGAVAQLIREREIPQVIVFSNTKIGCGRLARLLAADGLDAVAIHGDKTQQERLATLDSFKKGEIRVLVATDVAARGLDIAELPAVINYDLPYSPEDYVHRIGRTGRAGASGLALSLMTKDDDRLHAEIEKLLKRKLPPIDMEVARTPGRDTERDAARSGSRLRSGSGESRGRSGESAGAGSRGERTERPDRGERSDRSAGRRDRSRGSGGGAGLPGYSQDPFFFKPYESKAAQTTDSSELLEGAADATPGMTSRANSRKSRRGPLAALLGGLKQPG